MDVKHVQNEMRHVSDDLRAIIELFRPKVTNPNHTLMQKYTLVGQRIREYEHAVFAHANGNKGENLHQRKANVIAALTGFEAALGHCEIKFKDAHHRIHKLKHSIH